MRGRLHLTVVLLVATALPAGAAERLTLREAMARAHEHAQEAKAAVDRAQAAGARLKQAECFRLPSVSLQETWMRTDSPAEVFALQLNQQRFSFAAFTAGDPNRPDFLNTAISRVELSLPLYTGGVGGRARRRRGVRDGGAGAGV